jgi:multicomponent Na+:H+ antiporter subunit G
MSNLMQIVCDLVSRFCLLAGSFFALTGAVGIVRLPDFYSRLHPAGKSDSLAQTLILTGLLLQIFSNEAFAAFGYLGGIKLALISVFLLLTTPTATHAIAKAAYVSGLQPWSAETKKSGQEELKDSHD